MCGAHLYYNRGKGKKRREGEKRVFFFLLGEKKCSSSLSSLPTVQLAVVETTKLATYFPSSSQQLGEIFKNLSFSEYFVSSLRVSWCWSSENEEECVHELILTVSQIKDGRDRERKIPINHSIFFPPASQPARVSPSLFFFSIIFFRPN